jgi:hypothetical protein
MSPAEAAAILEEPDWVQRFADSGGSEIAFENLLLEWRKWHHTICIIDGVEKKKMAASVDGVIALALLGVMPPRNMPDRPPGPFEEQVDDMCWFVSEGRAWRILGIEDHMLFLNSFGDEKQIDLSRAKWDNYCAHHAAVLEAMRNG